MSLITALKVSLTFAQKEIFRKIGLQVEPGDRFGLVGPNGSGKTTLLRLLMGEILPDSGEVRVAKGTRIGYLPQDVQEILSGPLLQSVLASAPGRVGLERELRAVERSLKDVSQKQEQTRLAGRLAEIHNHLSHLDMQFPIHEAEKILLGLGFQTSDFVRPVSSLSGGWKMRAALTSLLYQKPDLFLLDEPTNHLDIPAVRWLEQFLQDFDGAMILVSHDREFLNRQIHRIISLEPEGMRAYGGNYDFYMKAREEGKKALEAKARGQDQKIKEARKFIERFRAKASKARQAQSKIKLVKKMNLVETRRTEKTMRFSFPEVPRSGREVVSIKGVSKGFGEKLLYKDLNMTVLRGERIAIIGPNGCGKTTLLRMVAGEIEPDDGQIALGHGVNMSYFAQHHSEMLDPRKTVIHEVYQVVPHETIGFVRGVCGAFLFSGEDVDGVTGTLSGGERARVSLAKLLVKPGNLMVMDEPTNHLDISSSETLIDALAEYEGTLLFVSHNQSFINRLATKTWDITGRQIVEYPGNLDEYYDHLLREEIIQDETKKGSEKEFDRKMLYPDNGVEKAQDRKRRNKKELKRDRAEKRRLLRETLKPIIDELEHLEGRIAEQESRQKDLENALADPEVFKYGEKSTPLINEYHDVKEELETLILKWEQCQDQLESTRDKLDL
ncbi:MAG: ATP-binding cassette domain-containing protein [Deltaproteobacteria bacterium]|nr:ATP-binding cassette domain-containing protein [Deltaproteobacteria bacterium]MBW1738336.1 ATP-binding cassette domain-containing protein [Deltaproteobacteria bacterium]MBW2116037.1 ATP-binding cassette domain-containing protein [Deltaproteobacteria bacterium]